MMVPILHSVLVDFFAHTTFLANTANCNKGSNNNSENLRSELEISNRTEVASKLSITYKTKYHSHFFVISINTYGITARGVYFSIAHDWTGLCVFNSVMISISKYFDYRIGIVDKFLFSY